MVPRMGQMIPSQRDSASKSSLTDRGNCYRRSRRPDRTMDLVLIYSHTRGLRKTSRPNRTIALKRHEAAQCYARAASPSPSITSTSSKHSERIQTCRDAIPECPNLGLGPCRSCGHVSRGRTLSSCLAISSRLDATETGRSGDFDSGPRCMSESHVTIL